MPIVPMTELLEAAERGSYAVGCYNAVSIEMIRGVLTGAERARAPVILCHAQLHFGLVPVETISAALCDLAEHATVPVAILLDHGEDLDTVERTIGLGFNSVMIDGSKLPYDENLFLTRRVTARAHELGASVEGELGRVTRPRSAGAMGDDEDDAATKSELYTDVEQAVDFVSKTGIDALAAAFGTAHGVYQQEPKIDFSRISELRQATGVPIVMHGGSGLTASQFRDSVRAGVRKVNYYSGMSLNAVSKLRTLLCESGKEMKVFLHQLVEPVVEAVAEEVERSCGWFGCAGRE